jgi:hypothetical protein
LLESKICNRRYEKQLNLNLKSLGTQHFFIGKFHMHPVGHELTISLSILLQIEEVPFELKHLGGGTAISEIDKTQHTVSLREIIVYY